MLILALSVCLSQSPDTCKEVQLPFFGDHLPASECVRYGEPEIRDWLARHPEWTVRRSACRPSTSMEIDA